MDQMFPKWVRVAWISLILILFAVGATKFLAVEDPSFYVFAPGAVISVVFLSFEMGAHLLVTVLPQYEIATAIAVGSFVLSVIVIVFALVEKDPGRQSALVGFGGSLLGFATGIPFGQFRASRRRAHRGSQGSRTANNDPTPPSNGGS